MQRFVHENCSVIYWSDICLMEKNYKPLKWPTVGDGLNKL